MEELKGIIFDTIYRNEENGYTVALLETDTNVVTITGNFPSDLTSETVLIYGKTIKHQKYGEQFQVEAYSILLPTELNQIENYLASGLIKGIGESIAKKIVEKFGEDTFKIIQKYPERLTEVEGIGDIKSKAISDSFIDQLDIKEIMMYLQNHNISPTYAVKIYKYYGNDTIKIINENPYRLSEDIFGIGFKLADKIASSMGVEKQSVFRIHSGIKYLLIESAAKGHSYVPKKILVNLAINLLGTTSNLIELQIREMALQDKIRIENFNSNECIYYIPYHNAEVNVCNKLVALSTYEFEVCDKDISLIVNDVQSKNNFELSPTQNIAVKEAIKNGVTVITGGPGTGKTTIIETIINVFENLNNKVLLCAPTGRAAKRMSESTQRESKTIHRMLEYAYGENDNNLSFNKNEESPLNANVIIVDEVSMIDIILMNNLLKAITTGSRLILVGDIDQLPSVGAGNVLKDIIASKAITTIKLDKIFRQAEGSSIIENAHRINNGEMPICNEKDSDFFFMRKTNNKEIANLIVDLYTERLPVKYKIDPIKDIQVLSPMKKGDVGVIEINNLLQEVINPPSKLKCQKSMGKIIFRVGDKVMQVKNNYQIPWTIKVDDSADIEGEGIYNGDIGYIIFIDENNQELIVEYDDNKEALYTFSQLDELILAYAATVHKSQGSEFPIVIIPMTWAPEVLLSRNLLYTAITRAKNLVVLVGQEKYVEKMVNNDKIDYRYSALDIRLRNIKEFYNW
ncbi:ATP-dependent RecD-like DNA helicase [Sedimentibacter sp. zth1]|uniref:SF1B family DNA helicase RecD2 n=1 Tax=Sedimentibacter sp. zth1 TaxID=2816908 RepID=UPI001A910A49|nr:ATP-dependent RecD-like DNA helicase [Sedimentibacter sp. zth1]QSX05058.1 ATP-dependent RecD-like DNA helicase [Sedimentibacter sp. zth1]